MEAPSFLHTWPCFHKASKIALAEQYLYSLSLLGSTALLRVSACQFPARAFRDCSSLLLNGSASGRRPAAADRQQSLSGKPKQKESSASLVMFFFSCMILHFRFVLLLVIASLGVSCVV